jgi:predicted DNA-binding transcriptional regulator YafY
MAETAASQLRRIMHLIPKLADGEDHRIDDIAAALESTPKQLVSDFQSICDRFDTPGGFVEGVQVYLESRNVSVHTSHFHRPMRLTMPELCALELGLTLLRRERTPAEADAIDRALARLRATISKLPENDRHDGIQHAELAAAGSANHLAALRSAIRDRARVTVRYCASRSIKSALRTGAPHCLMFAEQMWYVVMVGDDGAYRFFRLDRIEDVTVLTDHFEPDDSIVAQVLSAGRPFASNTDRHMRVRYSPRIARWVAEREGLPLAPDGSLTVDHPLADEQWALRHVLQYGPEAEILSPPEMRTLITERLSTIR